MTAKAISDQDLGLLLGRMTSQRPATRAGKATFALARSFSDRARLRNLVDRLAQAKTADARRPILFLMQRLALNADDRRAARTLVEFHVVENVTPIIKLTRDKHWLVRHSAIQALGASRGTAAAEAALIGVIRRSKDPFDLCYANAALGKVGTRRALPALVKLTRHMKEDVKCSAIAALGRIGDDRLTPTYVAVVKASTPSARWYAMLAILAHGDERAVEAVCARLRSVLARPRIREQAPVSEPCAAIAFLSKHRERAGVEEVLSWARREGWKHLFSSERAWLRKQRIKLVG